MKDDVCFILSYPPINSKNKERRIGWIRDILDINHRVRELKTSSKKKRKNVLKVLPSEIARLRLDSVSDNRTEGKILGIVKSGQTFFNTSKRNLLNLVTDFTVRQLLEYIELLELQSIAISMIDDTSIMSRLKNLPRIREIFNIVIQLNASSYSTIEGIEQSISRELGLSTSSEQDVDEFWKRKSFLILLDDVDRRLELDNIGINWWNSKNNQKIIFGIRPWGVGCMWDVGCMNVDLHIKMQDHLASWTLFCSIVGKAMSSWSIAKQVFKRCCGHLLVTELMARTLKGAKSGQIWKHASHALDLPLTSQTEDRILFNALAFILPLLGIADECLRYCAFSLESGGTYKVDLIESWMKGNLIGTPDEGKTIVQKLVNAFLLENCENEDLVRMRHEIRRELMNLFKTERNPMVIELDKSGSMEASNDEAWKKVSEIHLMNNKISKLPDNPDCPELNMLLLQANHRLRVIPPYFFECMSILQILDLSQTRIRSLPQSLFRLVQLRQFFLRGCELFMELPPEVGELSHLVVLDLEGTEIKNFPASVGKLSNLRCLKVSFYGYNGSSRKNHQQDRIIPHNVISNLLQLEELSIDVYPDDERWNVTAKDIIEEVCSLNRLDSIKLYLPNVVLLNDLKNESSKINLSWMHFRLTVGSHMKRIISRVPPEPAARFEEQESCLKYVNGKGVPTEIKEILQHATAFFLDRHITVSSLSDFGIENMNNLKFCIIGECNEMQTIGDVDDDKLVVPGSLEYLNAYYMKNLRSIWNGPYGWGFLYKLKVLELCSCPQLTTIFSLELVKNLKNLEELVLEDCPEINSIVTSEVPGADVSQRTRYLPRLKKMSLHYMPKLVSISGGLWISPSLEWLSIYDCPSLETLYPEEISSGVLKAIIGETDWWSSLKWNKSSWFQPRNLDAIFVSIERDKDLMTQIAEINNQLQALMQKTEPSPDSGCFSTSIPL